MSVYSTCGGISGNTSFVAGGMPLFVDGKIIGAIGIGGGTKEQDMEIANYVIAKFKELTE